MQMSTSCASKSPSYVLSPPPAVTGVGGVITSSLPPSPAPPAPPAPPAVSPVPPSTVPLSLFQSSSRNFTFSAAFMKFSGSNRLSCGRSRRYPNMADRVRGTANSRSFDKVKMVNEAMRRNRGPGASQHMFEHAQHLNSPSAVTASMTLSAVGHGRHLMNICLYHLFKKSLATEMSTANISMQTKA